MPGSQSELGSSLGSTTFQLSDFGLSYLTSLSLSFPICRRGIIISSLLGLRCIHSINL